MNVSGPTPITPLIRPDDASLPLKVSQRISAEVLQVAGERVELSVQGVRIVARLTPSDQAAALSEHKTAQFIVRELSDQVIKLQWLPPGPQKNTPQPASARNILSGLLELAGLAPDPDNLAIARALLAAGLPVTDELIAELKMVLTGKHAVTQSAAGSAPAQTINPALAQLAAELKAAGLPLSPGALALIQCQFNPLMEAVQQLRERLQKRAKQPLPPDLLKLLQSARECLDQIPIGWDGDSSALAGKLQQFIAIAGRSQEHTLAEQLRQGLSSLETAQLKHSLLQLAAFRREFARLGPDPLLEELDRFLDGFRLQQLANSETALPPPKERWINLEIPLAIGEPSEGEQPDLRPAWLRIADHPDHGGQQVDFHKVRLVLQVEIDPTELVEIDLSIAGEDIGMQITSSSDGLRLAVDAELPSLAASLKALDLNLHTLRSETGASQIISYIRAAPRGPFRKIDITV